MWKFKRDHFSDYWRDYLEFAVRKINNFTHCDLQAPHFKRGRLWNDEDEVIFKRVNSYVVSCKKGFVTVVTHWQSIASSLLHQCCDAFLQLRHIV